MSALLCKQTPSSQLRTASFTSLKITPATDIHPPRNCWQGRNKRRNVLFLWLQITERLWNTTPGIWVWLLIQLVTGTETMLSDQGEAWCLLAEPDHWGVAYYSFPAPVWRAASKKLKTYPPPPSLTSYLVSKLQSSTYKPVRATVLCVLCGTTMRSIFRALHCNHTHLVTRISFGIAPYSSWKRKKYFMWLSSWWVRVDSLLLLCWELWVGECLACMLAHACPLRLAGNTGSVVWASLEPHPTSLPKVQDYLPVLSMCRQRSWGVRHSKRYIRKNERGRGRFTSLSSSESEVTWGKCRKKCAQRKATLTAKEARETRNQQQLFVEEEGCSRMLSDKDIVN
jgi:hypothetical protein